MDTIVDVADAEASLLSLASGSQSQAPQSPQLEPAAAELIEETQAPGVVDIDQDDQPILG